MAGDARYNLTIDPARIAYGIMTGIGFLGAGAIIKQETGIRGLTTAAGLWCVAAIGMAAGFGMYVVSAAATLMVVAALWLLDYLDSILPRRQFRRLTVRCTWERHEVIDKFVTRLRDGGLVVEHFDYQRVEAPGDVVEITLTVSFLDLPRYQAVEAELHADPVYSLVSSMRI